MEPDEPTWIGPAADVAAAWGSRRRKNPRSRWQYRSDFDPVFFGERRLGCMFGGTVCPESVRLGYRDGDGQ